jgi:hypothetical protein
VTIQRVCSEWKRADAVNVWILENAAYLPPCRSVWSSQSFSIIYITRFFPPLSFSIQLALPYFLRAVSSVLAYRHVLSKEKLLLINVIIIREPTNALNKIQFLTSINLLQVSAPGCHLQGGGGALLEQKNTIPRRKSGLILYIPCVKFTLRKSAFNRTLYHLKTKRTQSVPRSKHSVSAMKTKLLMLYKANVSALRTH